MKDESSRKKATNMRKVPMTKQISEKRRIPAPTPDTVELKRSDKVAVTWWSQVHCLPPNCTATFSNLTQKCYLGGKTFLTVGFEPRTAG